MGVIFFSVADTSCTFQLCEFKGGGMIKKLSMSFSAVVSALGLVACDSGKTIVSTD